MEAAAGMAGLFKVILSLENQLIPGQCNFNKINKNNIIIESSGEKDPIADNASASGKSQNRRVEVRIITI